MPYTSYYKTGIDSEGRPIAYREFEFYTEADAPTLPAPERARRQALQVNPSDTSPYSPTPHSVPKRRF